MNGALSMQECYSEIVQISAKWYTILWTELICDPQYSGATVSLAELSVINRLHRI
jgi:hypothetical protein